MRLPFQLVKTFTTQLSKDEVIGAIRERLSRKSEFLFFSTSDYVGSIQGKTFKLYKNFNARYGRSNPIVKGSILSESPTTIEIKISPHYLRVLFFMIFALIFLPIAFLGDQMTINGVLREPTLLERIGFGLFGGGGPLIWCYFDCIVPISETESWIAEKLKLTEKPQYQL